MNKLNLMFKKNPKANFRDIIPGNYVVLNDMDSRNYLQTIGVEGVLISTPGHSDDSISLLLDNSCAFIGDLPALSQDEDFYDLVVDDSWDIIRSHDAKMIYPGHGEPYEI